MVHDNLPTIVNKICVNKLKVMKMVEKGKKFVIKDKSIIHQLVCTLYILMSVNVFHYVELHPHSCFRINLCATNKYSLLERPNCLKIILT